jgi:hypothetical protein
MLGRDTCVTGGGFHFPVSASDFGAQRRMVKLNGPFGVGSQLTSLSAPGLSLWKYKSSDPSAAYLNDIRVLSMLQYCRSSAASKAAGEHLMAKRRRSPVSGGSVPAKPAGLWTRPDIKHTSVYLPEAAYEALRQVAFDERRKIHDLLMEGVELALKKRGYPALADMKAKWQRKER